MLTVNHLFVSKVHITFHPDKADETVMSERKRMVLARYCLVRSLEAI